MSLKELKATLKACSYSRSTVSGRVPLEQANNNNNNTNNNNKRAPPKSTLRAQFDSLQRLAADLHCTLSGDSLHDEDLPIPQQQHHQEEEEEEEEEEEKPSLDFPECSISARNGKCEWRPENPLPPPRKKTRLLPEDGSRSRLDPDRLSIAPFHDGLCGGRKRDLQTNAHTAKFHQYSSNLRTLKSKPLSKKNVPAEGDKDMRDLPSDGVEDDRDNMEGDSEAGLFIRSHREGLFEPLVLWPSDALISSELAQPTVQVPASINSRLMDHQRVGIKFLYNLYRENRGGVLGDDMGLGKTIQTIAFLSAILKRSDVSNDVSNPLLALKPVLIMCPTSVLKNWEQEFAAWGSFKVAIYHGVQKDLVTSKLESKALEVILTSFDTFRIHGESLCLIDWECVVIDEVHRLKNHKSQLYLACAKMITRRRYGLTGTVMQNKLMDLFNVFDCIAPGCLGSREHFREYYDEPLKQGQRISAPERFVNMAEDRRNHLSKVLQKHLLRRTKEETIGHLMMGKEDNAVFCAMSPLQQRVYKRLLESPDFECLIKKDWKCSCGSPLSRVECCNRIVPDGIIWPYLHKDNPDGCDSCPYCLVLPCLTKLQQVSNHLELIKANPKDDVEKQKKDSDLAKLVIGNDAELIGGVDPAESFLALSDSEHCGKMRALEKLLAFWSSQGDKVLIFSNSVRMLDILDKFLIRKGYCFSRLDGSTPMASRQPIVEEFNNCASKQVFLISTRAGGLGLNLVSANRVIIFDPNWNPAQDLQAQDRSFRFGQRKHVTVFRLLAAASLEELVYTRQIYKQQLFNIAVAGNTEKRYFEGVQDSKENKGELFGISNLFRDLSDKVFTSDIIDAHEDRRQKSQLGMNAWKRRRNDDESDQHMRDRHDEISKSHEPISEAIESSNQQDSTSDDSIEGRRHKTRNVLGSNKLPAILNNIGVIYAHRNEDVVNNRQTKIPGTSSSSNPQQIHPCKSKLDKISLKVGVTSGGAKHSKKYLGRSAKEGGRTKAQRVYSKEQQFCLLAKYKGLDNVSFSKWLLSATENERQSLLSEFTQYLKK